MTERRRRGTPAPQQLSLLDDWLAPEPAEALPDTPAKALPEVSSEVSSDADAALSAQPAQAESPAPASVASPAPASAPAPGLLAAAVPPPRDWLPRWVQAGWLRAVDAAFAEFVLEHAPAGGVPLLLAAALASHQLGRGHACLSLADTLRDPASTLRLPPDAALAVVAEGEAPLPLPRELMAGWTPASWEAALLASGAVGAAPADLPLLLEDGRLYLRRYWQAETQLRAALAVRLAAAAQAPDPASLRGWLDTLFPPQPATLDWQKLACALMLRQPLGIITGGPGTGKTTTVLRLLALLQAQAVGQDGKGTPHFIRLAAPTGKAAARLSESLQRALGDLPWHVLPGGEALRSDIPAQADTLHRLLGSRPGTRRFRHDAERPIDADVVVVDEASMVDLETMAALLQALRPSTRLILLGDKDQLASVEAGTVLGTLCEYAAAGRYTPETAAWLQAATGQEIPAAMIDPAGRALDQAVVMLRHSHRFDARSGIGQLAQAVNAGHADRVADVWAHGYDDLLRLDGVMEQPHAWRRLVVEGRGPGLPGYAAYLALLQQPPATTADEASWTAWALEVLAQHARAQVLCVLRRGPWGVQGLNTTMIDWLAEDAGLRPSGEWYAGRPVIVTHNDYALGLMNGDVGLTLPSRDGSLRVVFRVLDAATGGVRLRWMAPSRLPTVETVFALTVHKSQGSEFDHVMLVLPEHAGPLLTRELLYTGITRARRGLSLILPGGAGLLRTVVGRRVRRAGGPLG